MKLSTIINAARKADRVSSTAALKCLNAPWDTPNRVLAHRKHMQAVRLFASAIQLADEQHDLIITQDELLDQFAQTLQEAQ